MEMDVRKELNKILLDITQNLSRIGEVKEQLACWKMSTSYAGDLMVMGTKMAKGIGGSYFYSEEDKECSNDQVVSRYDLDQQYLTNEPTLCYDKLSNIKNLIVECLELHTELYLYADDVRELIENVELLACVPIFKDSNFSSEQLSISNIIFKQKALSPVVGGIIGGISGLIASGILTTFLVRYLECSSCGCLLTKDNLFKNCGFFAHQILCAKISALPGTLFGVIFGVGILGGYAWQAGKIRREVLEDISTFRIKLKNSQIEDKLTALLTDYRSVRNGLMKKFQGSDVDLLTINIIMKAYKEYRRVFEEERKDPSTKEETDEALHASLRRGAFGCVEPLMKRFKMTKREAWELVDEIHRIVESIKESKVPT